MMRLTKKNIRQRETAAVRGEFDRSLFDWAQNVGLTFGLAGYPDQPGTEAHRWATAPAIAERDGVRLVGEPGHLLLVAPEYAYSPGYFWRAWLVESDVSVPTVTMAGVSGPASYVE